MANTGKKAVAKAEAEEQKQGIRDAVIIDSAYTEEMQNEYWVSTFKEEKVSTTAKTDRIVGFIKQYVDLMIQNHWTDKEVVVLNIFKYENKKHVMPIGDNKAQAVTGTDVRKAISRLMSNEVYKEELHAKGYRLITSIGTGDGANFKEVKPKPVLDENGNKKTKERKSKMRDEKGEVMQDENGKPLYDETKKTSKMTLTDRTKATITLKQLNEV